jgi:lipoprotein-anchoring transpeptidase ErfK/SrfK
MAASEDRSIWQSLTYLGWLILGAIAWVDLPADPPQTANAPVREFQAISLPLSFPVAIAADTLHLTVDLSDRRARLYRGDRLQASYPVAIGQPGWETPRGQFEIRHMRSDPAWEHPITGEIVAPGADNPLGDRWIGFWHNGETRIGFHGTADEGSIGRAVSHGCLRMRNQDIRDLYDRVEVGTPILVRP